MQINCLASSWPHDRLVDLHANTCMCSVHWCPACQNSVSLLLSKLDASVLSSNISPQTQNDNKPQRMMSGLKFTLQTPELVKGALDLFLKSSEREKTA